MVQKSFIRVILSLATVLLSSCTLDSPFDGVYCPEDRSARLSYVSYYGNICKAENCKSEDDCCSIEEKAMRSMIYDAINHSRCPQASSFSQCGNKDETFFCHSGFECSSGQSVCKGTCLAFASNHIASCDNDTIKCIEGFADCDGDVSNGCEANLTADASCGSCNNDCKTSNKACVDGTCQSNLCVGNANAPDMCIVGGENICRNVKSNDADHCGACNYKCSEQSVANATSNTCTEGKCIYECKTDYVNIGSGTFSDSIECVNPLNDNKHCGAESNENKGEDCTQKSGFICSRGICSESCLEGASLCKGSCIDKSATHVAGCDESSITCETDYADIDEIVTNGCEVNLKTDNNHCGLKGNICSNGRTCINGKCVCPSELTYCKTSDSTFACVDPSNSNQYCGCSESVIGKDCLASNQICTAGGCVTLCPAPTTLCKGACIDKSATHVAACDETSIKCESNYDDVDGKATNGCEVNLRSDENNCGSKGNKCTNGRTCSNGECQCPTGLTYCRTGNSTFACIDPANSNQYCGCNETSKGTNCITKGQICSTGTCTTTSDAILGRQLFPASYYTDTNLCLTVSEICSNLTDIENGESYCADMTKVDDGYDFDKGMLVNLSDNPDIQFNSSNFTSVKAEGFFLIAENVSPAEALRELEKTGSCPPQGLYQLTEAAIGGCDKTSVYCVYTSDGNCYRFFAISFEVPGMLFWRVGYEDP